MAVVERAVEMSGAARAGAWVEGEMAAAAMVVRAAGKKAAQGEGREAAERVGAMVRGWLAAMEAVMVVGTAVGEGTQVAAGEATTSEVMAGEVAAGEATTGELMAGEATASEVTRR